MTVAVVALFGAVHLAWGEAGDAVSGPMAYRDRLYDVAYADANVAVAIGYPGKIFRSEDGGTTWSEVAVDTAEPLFSIDFVDGNTGWIVGRSGLIFRTDDGGKTWTKQISNTDGHLFAVDFLNKEKGIAVGNFGLILRTADGGVTWTESSLEPMISASMYDVQIIDENIVYLAGEYPTWEAQLEEDVEASTLSSIFKSPDGGETWERVKIPSENHMFALSFSDEMTGYIAGTKGVLMETKDGGETWTSIDTEIPYHINDIFRSDDGSLMMAGNAGVLARLFDEKVTRIPNDAFYWLTAVAMNNAGRGVAVGNHGLIMITRDGGKTWR
ncbi:hypothetical protein KDL45_04945 [bacterium]|nr:hypothetical protein [bacterium]